MKIPNRKGIANQTVPESCVVHREVRHEALIGAPTGHRLRISPPKVHLKNLASLRVKHLGANEAFDKKQMQSYLQALVILGDAELNAVFHLLGINSKIVD